MSALDSLEPGLLWEHFSELTRIAGPRGRGAGARACPRLGRGSLARSAGRRRGKRRRRHSCVGRPRACAVVVLQAHLDIVCERDPTSPFDPREGRIDVRVEEDCACRRHDARRHDGIGVAAAMAVADDAEIEHGPLELLFTVWRSRGRPREGARRGARLRADADQPLRDERRRTHDRARRERSHVPTRPLRGEPVPPDHVILRIELSRAKGGHSGGDITAGRATRSRRWTRTRGDSGAARCIRWRRQPKPSLATPPPPSSVSKSDESDSARRLKPSSMRSSASSLAWTTSSPSRSLTGM